MCDDCYNEIKNKMSKKRKYKTASGVPFEVTGIKGDIVTVKLSTGNTREFHENHLVDCYHYMLKEFKEIYGVDKNPKSVRKLIGENGLLANCTLCNETPSYIWGILAVLPEVKRKKGNTLCTWTIRCEHCGENLSKFDFMNSRQHDYPCMDFDNPVDFLSNKKIPCPECGRNIRQCPGCGYYMKIGNTKQYYVCRCGRN
jgi:hypothetical protein